MEVQQKAHVKCRQLHVGQKLGFVDWQHRIQSLYFYNHTTTHDHIHAIRLIDLYAPVLNAQRHLPLHVEAPMGELNR